MHYVFNFYLLKKWLDDEYEVNYTENQSATFTVAQY